MAFRRSLSGLVLFLCALPLFAAPATVTGTLIVNGTTTKLTHVYAAKRTSPFDKTKLRICAGGFEKTLSSGGQIVIANHRLPVRQQTVDQIASEEARGAGNKISHDRGRLDCQSGPRPIGDRRSFAMVQSHVRPSRVKLTFFPSAKERAA